MSVLADKLTAIDSKVDAVSAVVAELKVKIADAPTPDDLAKLDAIAGKLDTITAPVAPPA